MSFVELRQVSKRFGDVEVLKGISLDVEEHGVVCLIGASGSGKSTLLRCINLLERLDGGDITVDGQHLTNGKVDVNALRRKIGIVFQAFNLFPHMTVIDNVALAPAKTGLCTSAQARERARALLTRIGLLEKADEYPDRLSGGQQQRVAIVRALAMEPKLMLLDEITSALDPQLVSDVLKLVRELAEGGMTTIMATHEMSFAREIADKVCFLDNGVILEEGPPEQIFSTPQQPRTREFLARVIEAGRLTRDALRALGLQSYAKTTGGRGLHVVVPVVPERDWSECLAFALVLGDRLAGIWAGTSPQERRILRRDAAKPISL